MKNILREILFACLALLGLSFGLSSCLDSGNADDPVTQLLKDIETIDNFLETSSIPPVEDVTGIRMVITELGTGLPALLTNSVDVDYVGKVFGTNATFDQGNVKGVLSTYISGWQIALISLPAGSRATLYIPSYWAYGNSTQGPIPANSILIFDIEFNKVIASAQELQTLAADTVAIDNYLTSKTIDAIKVPGGLRYVITEVGSGPIPTSWYDKVKVKFSYKLLSDDTKVVAQFEQEPSIEFYSRVVDYIHGVKIGLQKLPAGSKATLYVPSGLGYGPQPAMDQGLTIIPANSNIIVELEFIDIIEP